MRFYSIGLLVFFMMSCAESKFSGGENAPGATYSADAKPPEPVIPPPETILVNEGCDGEKIPPNAFPKEISECYTSGRVWNFASNQCVQMRAAEFECKWPNVVAELEKIGLKNAAVEKAAQDPSMRLVGCGQSQNKMRIVVQWLKVEGEAKECSQIVNKGVTTGCFTNYGAEAPPPPPKTPEEQDKRTYECMNL